MGDLFTHLADAPVANEVFLAGLVFLAVGVFGRMLGKVEPKKIGRPGAAVLGVALSSLGLYSHLTGDQAIAQTSEARMSTAVAATAGTAQPVTSVTAVQQKATLSNANSADGAQFTKLASFSPSSHTYYRLQLKHGGQYLDSDHCTTRVALFGRSDYDHGGCQLWRFVPGGDGYFRIQLKHGGQYLDADHCTTNVALFGYSGYDGGSCQLWRLVAVDGGYYRLQLKHDGNYLDSDHCTTRVALFGYSGYDDGGCQLWRLVPEAVPIDPGL